MRFALLLVILSVGFAVKAQVPDLSAELKTVLACHASTRKSVGPFYEVFDHGGLTLARENDRFTLTDGRAIYAFQVPVANPAAVSVDNRFRLKVETKTYCVHYISNRRKVDESREFALAPPATCPGSNLITAQPLQGPAAAEALQRLQFGIHVGLDEALDVAQEFAAKPGKSSRETQQVLETLNAMNPAPCSNINPLHPLLKADLVRLKSYQRHDGVFSPAEGSKAGRQ